MSESKFLRAAWYTTHKQTAPFPRPCKYTSPLWWGRTSWHSFLLSAVFVPSQSRKWTNLFVPAACRNIFPDQPTQKIKFAWLDHLKAELSLQFPVTKTLKDCQIFFFWPIWCFFRTNYGQPVRKGRMTERKQMEKSAWVWEQSAKQWFIHPLS